MTLMTFIIKYVRYIFLGIAAIGILTSILGYYKGKKIDKTSCIITIISILCTVLTALFPTAIQQDPPHDSSAPQVLESDKGSEIEDSMQYIGQKNVYIYTAPKTGNYRIECATSDGAAEYYITVLDHNDTKVYSRHAKGSTGYTLDLEENQTYQIVLQQLSETTYTYTLHILAPNDVQLIE